MKYFFLILLITCLSACRHSFEDKIVNEIENTCKGVGSCTINMNDIAEFKWDKMYVFNYTATPKEVSSIVGSVPHTFTELTRRIIFTLEGKIVYSEENETNVEELIDKEVVFDFSKNINFKSYTSDSCTFFVRRKKEDGAIYYELHQISK